MLLGTLCETMLTRPPASSGSTFMLFLMMLSHTSGKWYLPPSLLRLGFRTLMYIASSTPLSNHLESVSISLLSSSKEYSEWSMWMCFTTSETVVQGRRCSLNLACRDLSVSLFYTASHSSYLIFGLYTGPTTFSLFTILTYMSYIYILNAEGGRPSHLRGNFCVTIHIRAYCFQESFGLGDCVCCFFSRVENNKAVYVKRC